MKKIVFRFCCALVLAILIVAFTLIYGSPTSTGVTKAFAKIGYAVKSQTDVTPSEWDKIEFQMASKRIYAVKRKTALKNNPGFYPRFEVVEEVYPDEEKAKLRIERLQEKPPNLSIDQQMYWMVDGFQDKERVYFISTDAVIFYQEEMPGFVKNLQREIVKTPGIKLNKR